MPDYTMPGAAVEPPIPKSTKPGGFLAHHQRIAAFLRLATARARVAFVRTPWEIDRIFGLAVFGLGIVFYLAPIQVVHFGFRFLGPIIHIASPLVTAIGFIQMLVGIMEWHRARQVAAFFCFFVFAAIAMNNDSPSGQWIYGVSALAEALIVLKRY